MWVNMAVDHTSSIVAKWCCKCGTVNVHFVGEIDPDEYFTVGKTYEERNGFAIGDADEPECKNE